MGIWLFLLRYYNLSERLNWAVTEISQCRHSEIESRDCKAFDWQLVQSVVDKLTELIMCFWHFLQTSMYLLGKACLHLQGHWDLNTEPAVLPMLPASHSCLGGCSHAKCPCQGILGSLRESLSLSLDTSLCSSWLVAFGQINKQ